MAQSDPTLPTLRTLSVLPLRDADMLLSFAERLYGTQSTIEAHQTLRRIDTYRRLLSLPLSIGAMERNAIKSAQRDQAIQRVDEESVGTGRHCVMKWYERETWRLAS
jgi:hypothetical protein